MDSERKMFATATALTCLINFVRPIECLAFTSISHTSLSSASLSFQKYQSAPLFALDSSQDVGRSYQVEEEDREHESPVPNHQNVIQSEFVDKDGDDFSFYYRDEDEILTEREDRLYIDEHGVRRKIERCILVGVEDLAEQRKAKKAEFWS